MNILNKLTIKHLKMNKKRTIVTILGVILSTALMVAIGLLFSTFRDFSIKEIISNEGSQHITIELNNDDLYMLENNKKIKDFSYTTQIGFSLYEGLTNEYIPYIYVRSANNKVLKSFELVEGTLPENSNEIIIFEYLNDNLDEKISVGDEITLNIGNRYLEGNKSINNNKSDYQENETLINTYEKTYKVVGIFKRNHIGDYSQSGFAVFTTDEANNNSLLTAYITFKNPKDAYKNAEALATGLGYKVESSYNNINYYKEIEYNNSLLTMYGVSQYNNIIGAMSSIILIILTLISIACIIVIYNSFAISVMERKKQFGLFSSVGATKNQLGKTVFFEALIVGIIGIPLGIIGSFIGIGIVIFIVNNLIGTVFNFPLALAVYPLFIIIPIIFMIITIILSAYLPAKMASRVSPIVAIRQNDDIKIRGNKVKTPKYIRKIFGIEGELALKNIKRNKKKYRTTIVSLFISIVLFIAFSGFANYVIDSALNMADLPGFDISVGINGSKELEKDANDIINTIIKNEDVDKYVIVENSYYSTSIVDESYFTEEYKKYFNYIKDRFQYLDIQNQSVVIYGIDSKSYDAYKKQIGLVDNRPIIINYFSTVDYSDNNRKVLNYKPLIEKDIKIPIKTTYYNDSEYELIDIEHTLENPYYVEELPFWFMSSTNTIYDISIIVPIDELNEIRRKEEVKLSTIFKDYRSIHNNYIDKKIFIEADSYDNINKVLKEITDKNNTDLLHVSAINVKEELKLLRNVILVIKIFVYGFIALVTLIGVTSVFNTINTSIALRRREFSMLRSMGLTPRGFNKIVNFESLFFGLKSLMYGIPFGILVVYLLHRVFDTVVSFDNMLIPWNSILIAIVGVFIIILISMWYATIKIKKDNILDAIREENI